MAEPVRVRRLTDQEGQKLQQIVRRGSTSSVRYRRAMMLLASAGGNRVPVIAQLVQADEDTVREVIHRFNEIGLACLDPQWAGGRPRLLSPDDEDFIVATATTRPTKLGQPFTRWSLRKLAAYLRRQSTAGSIRIGREAPALPARPPRHHLPADQDLEGVHRPRPRRQARPDRAGPGPLPGPGLRVRRVRAARRSAPPRAPAGPSRARPTGCRRTTTAPTASRLLPRLLLGRRRHPVGRQPPPQGRREHPGRAEVDPRRPPGRRPDLRDPGQPVRPQGRRRSARWATKNQVELCFTPTYASWANPIEAHFGPLRQFTLANSNHPNHTVADPGPARLPALAQRQRPPPRRPGRPTPRTRPHPQREGHPLGRTPPHHRSLTNRELTQPQRIIGPLVAKRGRPKRCEDDLGWADPEPRTGPVQEKDGARGE